MSNHWARGIEGTAWSERKRGNTYRERAFAMRYLVLLYRSLLRSIEHKLDHHDYCEWHQAWAKQVNRRQELESVLSDALRRLDRGRIPDSDWTKRARELLRRHDEE